MALIEISDVWKVYDLGEVQVEALCAANLTIEMGEYVVLVGPSGSGKSTLMNVMGCLDRPTRGSYRLSGDEVATMSRDERARIRNRQLGFIFQNFNLLSRTRRWRTWSCRCCTASGCRWPNGGGGLPQNWNSSVWQTG